MSVTVAEFAAQRGMTRQGVYKAIKRFEIPTFQGVSNGKATQFMSDEDAKRLNEMLGPTEASNLILKQNLELQIQTEREQLIQKNSEKVESVLREKEVEMTKTRSQMMERIETGVSEMHQMVDEVRADFKKALNDKDKRITELENEKKDLQDQIARLKEKLQVTLDKNTVLQNELVFAQQHPYKNLKASWDRKKEAKKDGKSAEDNEERSSIGS